MQHNTHNTTQQTTIQQNTIQQNTIQQTQHDANPNPNTTQHNGTQYYNPSIFQHVAASLSFKLGSRSGVVYGSLGSKSGVASRSDGYGIEEEFRENGENQKEQAP